MKLSAAAPIPKSLPENRHEVRCALCRRKFDLFRARWCACEGPRGYRTKVCPGCVRCLCDRPELDDPVCWVEPPARLRKAGFRRLPVYYL